MAEDLALPTLLKNVESDPISLFYSDAENNPATSCAVVSTTHVHVSASCTCAAGACRVKVTGDNNYTGSAGFTYTVTVNGQVSNSATANLFISAPGSGALFRSVATGDDHACALRMDGSLFCAGDTWYGQTTLPESSLGSSDAKVNISSALLGGPASRVLADGDASCALLMDGTAKCWGGNYQANLGIASAVNAVHVPTPVAFYDGSSAAKRIRSMDVGDSFGCALSESGELRCWGRDYSQAIFGLPLDPNSGSDANVQVPTVISEFDGSTPAKTAVKFDVSYDMACALNQRNEFKCWGQVRCGAGNSDVQDGLPRGCDDLPTVVPQLMFGLDGSTPEKTVKSFSLGYGTNCLINGLSQLKCWGGNVFGRLGRGANYNGGDPEPWYYASADLLPVLDDQNQPVTATSIATGDYQSCAVRDLPDHSVVCWGANWNGNLGNLTTTESKVASTVLKQDGQPLTGVSEVIAGYDTGSTCALLENRELWCWGANYAGQALAGFGSYLPSPMEVSNFHYDQFRMNSGFGTYCGLTGGAVSCYGNDSNGLDGTADGNSTPSDTVLPLLDGTAGKTVTWLSKLGTMAAAILSDGTAVYWGGFHDPTPVSELDGQTPATRAKEVVPVNPYIGAFSFCVLLENLGVKCANLYVGPNDPAIIWNSYVGGFDGTSAANQASAITGTVSGGDVCLIRASDGEVQCFGSDYGATPTPIELADHTTLKAASIDGYANHTCAVTSDGKILCWGENSGGQLGDGTTVSSAHAVYVNGFDGSSGKIASRVAVGTEHSCAIYDVTKVACWGHRNYGILGLGSSNFDNIVPEPAEVTGFPAGFVPVELSLSDQHSCVKSAAGKWYCWGNSNNDVFRFGMNFGNINFARKVE